MQNARGNQSAIKNKKCEIGASLVEILVAAAIIASALVIFIAALSTGAFAVHTSKSLTTANNLAAAQLESIKAQPYTIPSSCGATDTYARIAEPPGYAITVATCELSSGLEQITVTISYTGGSIVMSNYKVDR